MICLAKLVKVRLITRVD